MSVDVHLFIDVDLYNLSSNFRNFFFKICDILVDLGANFDRFGSTSGPQIRKVQLKRQFNNHIKVSTENFKKTSKSISENVRE